MTSTLEQVSNWLDKYNLTHQYNKQQGYIEFIKSGDDKNYQQYTIQTHFDNNIFEMRMALLDNNKNDLIYKDNKYLSKIFLFILNENFDNAYGTWSYSTEKVGFPIFDTDFTQIQFENILKVMVFNGSEFADKIKYLMDTGELPEKYLKKRHELEIAFLESRLADLKGNSGHSDDSFGDKI